MSQILTPQSFSENANETKYQVIFKTIWMVIKTKPTPTEFQPEIFISVWCSSAVAKYMAGVNIETFPICTFTVQIDKQASICTHQKELQKKSALSIKCLVGTCCIPSAPHAIALPSLFVPFCE